MFCVGLTGTIGSGKSCALNIFKELGAYVISADTISHEITAHNIEVLHKIAQYFGNQVINHQGELDRKLLRQIIFKDKEAKLWLEKLLHPLIRQKIIEEIKNCNKPYCVIEIPLLIDKTQLPYITHVLLLSSTKESKIKRVVSRDNISKEDAINILASQASDVAYTATADEIIENNGSIDDLRKSLITLHNKLINSVN